MDAEAPPAYDNVDGKPSVTTGESLSIIFEQYSYLPTALQSNLESLGLTLPKLLAMDDETILLFANSMDKSSTADLVPLTQALKQYKTNINQTSNTRAHTNASTSTNNLTNNYNNNTSTGNPTIKHGRQNYSSNYIIPSMLQHHLLNVFLYLWQTTKTSEIQIIILQ